MEMNSSLNGLQPYKRPRQVVCCTEAQAELELQAENEP